MATYATTYQLPPSRSDSDEEYGEQNKVDGFTVVSWLSAAARMRSADVPLAERPMTAGAAAPPQPPHGIANAYGYAVVPPPPGYGHYAPAVMSAAPPQPHDPRFVRHVAAWQHYALQDRAPAPKRAIDEIYRAAAPPSAPPAPPAVPAKKAVRPAAPSPSPEPISDDALKPSVKRQRGTTGRTAHFWPHEDMAIFFFAHDENGIPVGTHRQGGLPHGQLRWAPDERKALYTRFTSHGEPVRNDHAGRRKLHNRLQLLKRKFDAAPEQFLKRMRTAASEQHAADTLRSLSALCGPSDAAVSSAPKAIEASA